MNFLSNLKMPTKIAIIAGIVIIVVAAMVTGNFEVLLDFFRETSK